MEEERLIVSTRQEEDGEVENKLRPKTMADFVGQDKIKENLSVFISAAKLRGEALDHVLLYGPPGLGKTTLANIISNELNAKIKVTSGPLIERAADLAALLTNLEEGDVLFIDEIHRLNHSVEEILYPAMEDYRLDFIIGKGPSAKSIKIGINKFTLIGATTRAGMLSSPLRDRFGVLCRMEMYNVEELLTIVARASRVLGLSITDDACREIAKRSRGTPRIANRLLKRVSDFTIVSGKKEIGLLEAKEFLTKLEVDELGLDRIDLKLLDSLINKFKGGPCGLDTLSASINEDNNTIEDVYEPYLLQIGFIARTPRGRVALPDAYKHLGIELTEEKRKQITSFS